MSKVFRKQYAEPLGGIIEDATGLRLFAAGAAAPTASIAGYQVGCLYINTAGSVGSLLYINTGSVTSATWLNIA